MLYYLRGTISNVACPSPKEEMVMEAMAMVETVMVAVMVEMEMVLAEMVPVETAVPELVSVVYLVTWKMGWTWYMGCLNTLRPKQNGQPFPDDLFKLIFVNENVWTSIEISQKFVHEGPINNIPALVEKMASRRPGDKPLSEPMTVSLLTHICVTRPQWVNTPD